MSDPLFEYQRVNPTTWGYLSSLLMIALFFKFSRFWSVRNLDLVLLLLLAPGLILVNQGRVQQEGLRSEMKAAAARQMQAVHPAAGSAPQTTDQNGSQTSSHSWVKSSAYLVRRVEIDASKSERFVSEMELEKRYRQSENLEFWGFLFLFAVGLGWMIRLLFDATMVRRPLLEPNLSPGGMTFLGSCLSILLLWNILTGQPLPEDLQGPRSAEKLLLRRSDGTESNPPPVERETYGPGLAAIFLFPTISVAPFSEGDTKGENSTPSEAQQQANKEAVYTALAKVMAVLSQLAVVVGIMLVGYWHFHNVRMGIGAATLYLILPYTAQMTGRVNHVLPAALLVWAILFYRRPLAAGIFVGLASGVVYYPLFLLPLWISFYWQRGLMRFLSGVACMLIMLAVVLTFVSSDVVAYFAHLQRMFGLWKPVMEGLQGVWAHWSPYYRLPILALFVALSISLAFWPAQKNLGTLMSGSAAIMVAAQFWHGFGGGLYMAWYLPLVLMTVFRPNLEDRVALSVLGENWLRTGWRQWTGLKPAA